MTRRTAHLIALLGELDDRLETRAALFVRRRPWFTDHTQPLGPTDLTDEEIEAKVDNDIAIQEIAKEVEKLWSTSQR